MALNMLFKNQDSIMKCLRMRGYNNIEVEEALLTEIIMKRQLFRYFLLSDYFLPKKHEVSKKVLLDGAQSSRKTLST